MGLNSTFKKCACLSFASALLVGVNGAALAAPGSEPATCTGCTVEAGFGIVSYTKVVETVIIATETVQPYVYIYDDDRSPITTHTTIYSIPPSGDAWDDITPTLTWTIPDLDSYTFTWPTTYAVVTALDGGVNGMGAVKRDGSPASCTAHVSKVEIPRPVDCGNLVFVVSEIGYDAAPTIPPAFFKYLNGVPHIKSQFAGNNVDACQRVVAAAPGTAVPSFIDPPNVKIRGRLRPRQATGTTTAGSSSSSSSSSSTSGQGPRAGPTSMSDTSTSDTSTSDTSSSESSSTTSTTTSRSTSSTTSTTTSTSTSTRTSMTRTTEIETTLLPTEDPQTLTTITKLTSTTFPTITVPATPRPPQSVVMNTTSVSISIGITSSAVVIGSSKTISKGSATTISGVPISVPTSASRSIVIGNTTVPLQSSLIIIPSATTTLPRTNGTVPPMTTFYPPPVGEGARNAIGVGSWTMGLLGLLLWWL